MNLATNQRAQRRDRTNVCTCHLDHLLRLPWAQRRRVPPTEAARPKLSLKGDVGCGASKASSRPLYDRLRANAARAGRLRAWDPLTFAVGVARAQHSLLPDSANFPHHGLTTVDRDTRDLGLRDRRTDITRQPLILRWSRRDLNSSTSALPMPR